MTQEEDVLSSSVSKAAALPDISPKVEDLKASNKAGRAYRHTFPVHTKTKPSPLSKEAPPESYRGFVNLGSMYRGRIVSSVCFIVYVGSFLLNHDCATLCDNEYSPTHFAP